QAPDTVTSNGDDKREKHEEPGPDHPNQKADTQATHGAFVTRAEHGAENAAADDQRNGKQHQEQRANNSDTAQSAQFRSGAWLVPPWFRFQADSSGGGEVSQAEGRLGSHGNRTR